MYVCPALHETSMYNCDVCHGWFRHVVKEQGCGLMGFAKHGYGKEMFHPCEQKEQMSLFS